VARTALIGHNGFVGSTLKARRSFDHLYNSSNIEEIAGQSYDRVVCAGVSAVKWLANKDPAADRAAIARLAGPLEKAKIGELILISTIDVHPDPTSGDDEGAIIDPAGNHAYGAHRFELEEWARKTFPICRIVRLPALFGAGLRKNALFDLLHDNGSEKINPLARFQWYPLGRLADDIDIARQQDLKLVNLFGENLAMGDLRDSFFQDATLGEPVEPAPVYDLRTRHAHRFGGQGGYIMDASAILEEMALFIGGERLAASERDA
jgi:hypothetical protein